MDDQQELYCIRIGRVYFVGMGNSGFRLNNDSQETLTLMNARARVLEDPYVGFTRQGIFIWKEEHLRELLNYLPKEDIIPSLTFLRKGIDQLVAFDL